MIYTSTRDSSVRVSAAEAIAKGISDEGGLFVPMTIPTLNLVDIEKLARLDYIGRAKEVLKNILTGNKVNDTEVGSSTMQGE